MQTKVCCRCKEEKPIDQFSRNKGSKDGYKEYCKGCASIMGAEYRKTHSEKKKASSQRYYLETKSRAAERTAEEKKKTPFKICTICGEEKPIAEFYKRGDGGYRSYCKLCANQKSRENYHSKRDELVEKKREYNRNRKEEIREYNREYYKNHTEEVRERVRIWEEANPEQAAENQVLYFHRARARRTGNLATFTRDEWKVCKAFFTENGVLKCAYCGKEMKKATQDHVIPDSSGGPYTAGNIVPACTPCNASKGNTPFEEWYPKQPFYSEERENKIKAYLAIFDMPTPRESLD